MIVIYQLPPLARVSHLALSLVVFMWVLYLCRVTWLRARAVAVRDESEAAPVAIPRDPVFGIALAALIGVYCQVLLGALIRHTNATFALQLGWDGAIVPVDPTTMEHTLWPIGRAAQANALHRYVAVFILFL